MNKVRIAMIGAGMMANKVHYPSLASLPQAEMVGICDLNPARLTETADRYQIPNRYSDYRKMLEDLKPDGVYVVMPPQYMYDIVSDCLRRGIHVFTEKPLGLSLHQAETLARLAEENGVITQVGHQRRSPAVLGNAFVPPAGGITVPCGVLQFFRHYKGV